MTTISTPAQFYSSLMNAPPPVSGNFVLGNSIDMTSYSPTPKSIPTFQGVLDGSGFTVTISLSNILSPYLGLFSDISGGTVRNLTVRYINGPSPSPLTITTTSTTFSFGLLAANCTNSSNLQSNIVIYDASSNQINIRNTSTSTTPTSVTYVGGLVGWNQTSSQITRCNLQLNTDFTFDISSNYVINTGGLIGYNDSSADISGCSGEFRNFTYNLTGISGEINGGLILGRNNGNGTTMTNTISDCSGSLRIEGTNLGINVGINRLGGLVGRNSGLASISNCSINIKGTSLIKGITNASNNIIGGLVGLNDASSSILTSNVNYNSIFDISGSSVTGNIYTGGLSGINVNNSSISGCTGRFRDTNIITKTTGNNNMISSGGLIGRNEQLGSITNSYVDYSGTLIINGDVSGNNSQVNIGGINGYNFNNSRISDCSGNMRSTTQLIGSSRTAPSFIGGIVGTDQSGSEILRTSITYNNNLDISGTSTSGLLYSGGIAGFNTTNSDISGCTGLFRNTNIITKSTSGSIYNGGLVGRNDTSGSIIINSSVDYLGSLIINGDTSGNGIVYIGGINGNNVNSSIISDCSGNMRSTAQLIGKTYNNFNNIGGLVGLNITNNALIQKCNITYNNQLDISGTSTGTGAILAGGLVGSNTQTGDISGCSGSFRNTNINVNSNTGSISSGGFIALNDTSGSIINNSSVDYSGSLIINNVINTGSTDIASGGLVGSNSTFGEIRDCSGTIRGISQLNIIHGGGGQCVVGGLIAYDTSGAIITNSRVLFNNHFDISGNFNTNNTSVGGLIGGINAGSDVSGCSGSFRNTNININSNSGLTSIGGLLGSIDASGTVLENSSVDYSGNLYINGKVSTGSNNLIVAGLFGGNQNSGIIRDCSGNIRNTATLISTHNGTGNNIIGGLIGGNDASGSLVLRNQVTYNTLDISGTSTQGPIIAGGLVGLNNNTADISGCSGLFRNTNIILKDVSGNIYAGGLAGDVSGTGTTITNSYVDYSGSLLISSDTSGNSISYVGGLHGYNFNGSTISDCSGNIRGTAQLIGKTINGLNTIGGLVGQNVTNNALIQRCNIVYNNTLDISGTSTGTGAILAGGLVGSNTQTGDISGCTGSFRTTNIIIDSSGNSHCGGLVGFNDASGSTILNTFVDYYSNLLINGNVKSNVPLFIGGICGYNSNTGLISDCSGNIRGTTTFIGRSVNEGNYIGGLVGRNNATNALIQRCNITYNNTLDISGTTTGTGNIFTGGLVGLNTLTGDISGCSGSFNKINAIVNGNNNVYLSGIVGQTDISGSTIINNNVSFGSNSYFESTNDASGVYMGGIAGNISGSTVSNNTITYGDKLTLKAKQLPPTSSKVLYLNSDYGLVSGIPTPTNNTVQFVTYPLEFESNGTNVQSITFDSTVYPVPAPPGITTIKGNGFNIDLSDITLYIYLFNEETQEIIGILPPCCVANTLVPNPQVTDYDSSVKEGNKNNSTLVKSVDQFYTAVATRVRTAHSQPIFSSYQAYIQYLQGKNKR